VAAHALSAFEDPVILHDGEPDAKTAADAVIVVVSVYSSAFVKPTWNSIFERVSPVTRLPVNVGTDVHVSMVAVVVYPATLALLIVDFAETAVKVTDVTAAGFSASPPVHVNVLAPTGIVPPAVNVKTFPLTPAALLLIVTLEETHTGGGDALGSQIDALAVIFIQSFDKRASVTRIENTTAAGATPAFKLPVAVTDELHVNALVVVYPTCPAIVATDFEDTALNVTVVDDGGFASKNAPEHVIVVAPAAMPALPTVIVSVVVSVELALIAFTIPAMLHVGAFAGAKTTVEAVIVTESALISASLTPMWNCIWVIISPAKRLP
jgi:hypothetical protein